ncbi:MAG: hypothetical protein ACJAT5_000936 [Lentimonas sp.]|jgi:hypothetical protein
MAKTTQQFTQREVLAKEEKPFQKVIISNARYYGIKLKMS